MKQREIKVDDYIIIFNDEPPVKKKAIKKNGTYIIRVYAQDLKDTTPDEMMQDLIKNGLEIIKMAGSSFGACFFIEVKGTYKGLMPIDITDINPKTFDWIV